MAPSLTLSVIVEQRADDSQDVHFHAGGQGFWVARLVARLDVHVTLCAPLGGEPGQVLRGLVESEGVALNGVRTQDPNPVHVSMGKEGERATVAETEAGTLSRHELDEMYGAGLSA